jgi:hypothetical protein
MTFECELFEQTGIVTGGHPWLRPVRADLSEVTFSGSAYCSIAIQLVCVGLSALGPTDLQDPNLWILSIIVLLGVLLILVDEIVSCRNHRLGLLRLSAAKSRVRMARLGIKSKQVDRFLHKLWLNRELEFRFRNAPSSLCY